jgi:hypothetical protein
MREAVELHDSEISLGRHSGSSVVLVAVVHLSEDRPGYDSGTTGTQLAELVVEEANVESIPSSLPLSILSGQVFVGAQVVENLLPLPFDVAGDVLVELIGVEETLSVRGRVARVVLRGDWKYLDAVPGNRQ